MTNKIFSILNAEATIPIVANIPHASDFIPEDLISSILLSPSELQLEQRRLVDWFTDDLFAPIAKSGGAAIVSHISRFAVDTERYSVDAEEIMAERGMGAIYTKTTSLTDLRNPIPPDKRELLLNKYYWPYHQALNVLCTQVIQKFGYCILLDCHSFPEHELPYELGLGGNRPDICIGISAVHTPTPLTDIITKQSEKHGYSVAVNAPFAGCMIPSSLTTNPRFFASMIEVNRSLYMDENITTKSTGFPTAVKCIGDITNDILVQARDGAWITT